MSIVPRGMSVTEAYRLYRSENLLVNRKYQRKLVWTILEKKKLIESLLKGYPIPLILFAERPQLHGSGKYEIIDGMQRLNAIFGFVEHLFTTVNDKYFDLEEFSYAKQLAEKKVFKSVKPEISLLSKKECADILDYQLAVTIYTAMEEEDITEIFGRINSSGKHLSRQERRQAGVTTLFAEVVRNIAMKLRGDDSQKILHLFDMPEISIDSRQSTQGYKIKAEDTIWCKQGALTPGDLRDSQDEEMISDILASILLNEPLSKSTGKLDELYDRESNIFSRIESSLAVYQIAQLEKDVIKTFAVLRETIELHSIEHKCLLRTVNPNSSNPIPTAFYIIFMAFFDLVIRQELSPIDPDEIIKSLENLQEKLDLSRRYTAAGDRKKNINQTKGLIQNYFAKQEPSALGKGVELVLNLENSLRRSRIETARYECKQGLLDLSSKRNLNNHLLQKIVETICGIANLRPDEDGYLFMGVADVKSDMERIQQLDKIEPIEINGRYIVGIDREAELQNKSIEDYVKILINTIINSQLTKPLKTQVLGKFDIISYKGYSVIRITIPAQTDVSFIENKAFTRKGSSTVEIKGPELIAVSKLFRK